MKILAIDTSGKITSFAVIEDDKILIETNLNVSLTHSQTLLPICKNALDNAKINLEEIDYFAASVGPGSFTGLRIGISAIKGFAFALNKPCVAVSSLEGLAYNLIDCNVIAACIIEVRNEQAYVSLFRVCNKMAERLCEDIATTLDEFKDMISKYSDSIYFLGDTAHMWYDRLKGEFNNIYLPSPILVNQKASSIAMIAKELIRENKVTTSDALNPCYIRLPQAQNDLINRGITK